MNTGVSQQGGCETLEELVTHSVTQLVPKNQDLSQDQGGGLRCTARSGGSSAIGFQKRQLSGQRPGLSAPAWEFSLANPRLTLLRLSFSHSMLFGLSVAEAILC